ncbi:MAG: hypothetical protein IKA32_07055, partial [Lentisphaeria bacterium]|nr:hypothetical protein [Lentisphaeria bacterium]
MKKWFDRLFIGKLSIQLIAVVLAIGFISVFSGILLNVYSRHAIFGDNFFIQSLKGFFQLIDNSDAKETLNSFENIVKKDPGQELYAPVIILISLFVWMLGTVLFSFITAAFANAFDARNRLIASGAIRYKFSGRHGIIIGWDFTAISLVRNLLNQHHAKEIAILSALSSELIRDELRQEFSQQELKKIYVFQGDCFSQTDIDSLCAWNAGTVFITGHKQSECDCSSNIKIYTLVENSIDKKIGYWSDFPRFEAELPLKHPFVFKLISFKPNYFVWSIFTKLRYRTTQQFLQEPLPNVLYRIGKKIYYPRTPVKIFPDISNTTVFTKVFNPATAGHIVAYPYNYCTAAFRELYCGLPQNKNNAFFHYTPLKFRRGAKNGVHLLLSGFNDMARAIITESLRIIPENECKITIFLSDEKERRSCDLFIRTVIGDNSGGCCITVLPYDICHPAVRDSFTAAIKDDNTSTTLFITGHKTDEVLQTFSVLAEKIGHWNVQVVLEQRVRSKMVVPRDRIQKNSTCRVNYLGLLDLFCTTLDMLMDISKKTFIRQNGLNENSTDLDSFFWNCRYQDKRQQAEDFALAIPEKLYQCNYDPGDGDLREIIRSLKGIHIPTGIFRNTVGI